MIHFDFDDRHQDEFVVGAAIARRDGIQLAILVHVLIGLLFVYGPRLAIFQPSAEELQRQAQAQQQPDENPRMVFVEPKIDLQALRPPERAPASDVDRRATTVERAPTPSNIQPFSRGNSAEMNETSEAARARGPQSPTPPSPEPPQVTSTEPRLLPQADNGLARATTPERQRPRASGALGDALRNLQRYVQNQTFDNPQGGNQDPGAQIQFDTKGVEFGPWLRRFVSRVKRNWFVPQAAMAFRGHVVIQFNIWKDGHISDVTVVQPSSIDSFNNAAFNAILSSSPVDPLPPEYPTEKAFFTVTFYYNEEPPGR